MSPILMKPLDPLIDQTRPCDQRYVPVWEKKRARQDQRVTRCQWFDKADIPAPPILPPAFRTDEINADRKAATGGFVPYHV